MASGGGSSSPPSDDVHARHSSHASKVVVARDLVVVPTPLNSIAPSVGVTRVTASASPRVLSAGSVPSPITPSRLLSLREAYMLPALEDIHLPSAADQPDTHIKGYTCLYL